MEGQNKLMDKLRRSFTLDNCVHSEIRRGASSQKVHTARALKPTGLLIWSHASSLLLCSLYLSHPVPEKSLWESVMTSKHARGNFPAFAEQRAEDGEQDSVVIQ